VVRLFRLFNVVIYRFNRQFTGSNILFCTILYLLLASEPTSKTSNFLSIYFTGTLSLTSSSTFCSLCYHLNPRLEKIMRLINLVPFASSALALTILPTTTPALVPRDTTVSPSPTAAPTGIYFSTTIYDIIPGVTNDQVTIPQKTITIVIPTCSHTITPDKNGYVPPGTCGALYEYYPSFGAAIFFSILFGVLSISHIFLAAKFKTVSPHEDSRKRYHEG